MGPYNRKTQSGYYLTGQVIVRRTAKYASLLRISGALHLSIFEQPEKNDFSSNVLIGPVPFLLHNLFFL